MNWRPFYIVFILSFIHRSIVAQPVKPVATFFAADSSAWIRFTGAVQVWTRYTDNNPGSALSFGNTNYPQPETFDIGIRRARFQAYGPLSKRIFFYSQFGINNFTYHSPRKSGAFFHDLTAEYGFIPGKFHLGAGLTGWSGLARYASPSIASTLMYDAPLFQQATNDVNDQFLRKLSVFAKGQLGALDYRVALGKPFMLQQSVHAGDTVLNAQYANVATFSPRPPQLQSQAYLFWQFLERESNLTPYTQGTYLGKKRIFNLGGGVVYQPEAVRYRESHGNVAHAPLVFTGADLFLDYALNREARNAITVYGGFFHFNYGPNYVKPLGVMNTVNTGMNPSINKFSGFGNAFAMNGTGNVLYGQAGYLFRKNLLGSLGTLQPYADLFVADYEAIDDKVIVWNAGINWLVLENHGRISFNYQERPVVVQPTDSYRGKLLKSARRGMAVLQMQVFF